MASETTYTSKISWKFSRETIPVKWESTSVCRFLIHYNYTQCMQGACTYSNYGMYSTAHLQLNTRPHETRARLASVGSSHEVRSRVLASIINGQGVSTVATEIENVDKTLQTWRNGHRSSKRTAGKLAKILLNCLRRPKTLLRNENRHFSPRVRSTAVAKKTLKTVAESMKWRSVNTSDRLAASLEHYVAVKYQSNTVEPL